MTVTLSRNAGRLKSCIKLVINKMQAAICIAA